MLPRSKKMNLWTPIFSQDLIFLQTCSNSSSVSVSTPLVSLPTLKECSCNSQCALKINQPSASFGCPTTTYSNTNTSASSLVPTALRFAPYSYYAVALKISLPNSPTYCMPCLTIFTWMISSNPFQHQQPSVNWQTIYVPSSSVEVSVLQSSSPITVMPSPPFPSKTVKNLLPKPRFRVKRGVFSLTLLPHRHLTPLIIRPRSDNCSAWFHQYSTRSVYYHR